MLERKIGRNEITVSGKIVDGFTYSHKTRGEAFYSAMLSSERFSGRADVLPLIVSERIIDPDLDYKNQRIQVNGTIRSYNEHENGKSHLRLVIFSKEIALLEDTKREVNKVSLSGYICKPPIYRETPLGREICDVFLAVNRSYGKVDYIPCLAWSRNAKFVSRLSMGVELKVEGRFQSRDYTKKNDDNPVSYTTYEVSGSFFELLSDGQKPEEPSETSEETPKEAEE